MTLSRIKYTDEEKMRQDQPDYWTSTIQKQPFRVRMLLSHVIRNFMDINPRKAHSSAATSPANLRTSNQPGNEGPELGRKERDVLMS